MTALQKHFIEKSGIDRKKVIKLERLYEEKTYLPKAYPIFSLSLS